MHLSTPTSRCDFGIARADITPPVGMYHRMWGAAVHDRSEGIHQPLLATAVSFRRGSGNDAAETRQVVVTLDHCLLGRAEMDALLAAVQARAGIPAESVVVTFSHTHGAGLLSLDRVDLPGGDLIPDYLQRLQASVAELVRAAVAQEVPALLTYGHGRCGLAAHRDFWDEASRQWVCGFNPQGEGDDTLLVADVRDRDGKLLATLVNYACHPTTLAWDNRLVSPDYPGTTRLVIEQATGAPCVFLQGASGDLGPRHGFVGDVQVAERNGRQLGYAALSALEALPPSGTRFEYAGPVVSGATIGVWKYVPETRDRQAET
ncbi:MAG: neutral/alkaline non-lysosomal ceramidase N-terminal domain-containing protein, partial [Pirellulaceae bacterium]